MVVVTINPEPPEVAAVRAGEELDWSALERYVRANVDEVGEDPMEVLQFPNGSANLTYLLRFGPLELVLRRPPFGIIAPGAHDMKREHKVLSRLWRYFDRAPRSYALCTDHAVIGADFFVMERRIGEVVRGVIPASMRHHTDAGRRMGFALTDAIAEMHQLDPTACELADLGKPEGFVGRQVGGWAKRWELARPEGGSVVMDDVAARLGAMLPPMTRTSIVHNDLKLDNCQYDSANPDRVKSIFDWDMTTLGDPLIDLGTLIQYWPDPSDAEFASRMSYAGLADMGLPTRDEIATRYAERTGAPLDNLSWWVAFAYWKTAVVVQQLYNRYARGETKDERFAAYGDRVFLLADKAADVLERRVL